jgi:hypothetical protein
MNTAPNYTYTLVGYREDGVDTCRGCVMDRSGSDFFLSVFFTAEEVAAEWARRLFAEESMGREYCSFEYTLLLDGRDDNNDPDSWQVEALCNPQTGNGWAEEARTWVKARADELFAQLKAEKLAADERAKKAKEVQEIGRRAKARQEAEAAERAEYLRLQAKFSRSGS